MKKIFLTAFLVLFGATSLLASYEDALKLYQDGKYRESLDILGKELDVSKDLEEGAPNYNIRFLAAHNHWKLGNDESAIAHFKRCIDIKKDAVEPYIDLSLFLLERDRLNDAEIFARQGLRIKNSAMLYYVLGRSALKRKNYWRAKELFETANSLDPELYISYNELGITLMNLNKYGDANTAFSVAMALSPEKPELLNNMGLCLEKLQKYKESYQYLEKANSMQMENKAILENMLRVKKMLK